MRNMNIVALMALFFIGCITPKEEVKKKNSFTSSYSCISTRYRCNEFTSQRVCKWWTADSTNEVCTIENGYGYGQSTASVSCEFYKNMRLITEPNEPN